MEVKPPLKIEAQIIITYSTDNIRTVDFLESFSKHQPTGLLAPLGFTGKYIVIDAQTKLCDNKKICVEFTFQKVFEKTLQVK